MHEFRKYRYYKPNPAIIYFEWNTDFTYDLKDSRMMKDEKKFFIKTHEQNKMSFVSIISTNLVYIQA